MIRIIRQSRLDGQERKPKLGSNDTSGALGEGRAVVLMKAGELLTTLLEIWPVIRQVWVTHIRRKVLSTAAARKVANETEVSREKH